MVNVEVKEAVRLGVVVNVGVSVRVGLVVLGCVAVSVSDGV